MLDERLQAFTHAVESNLPSPQIVSVQTGINEAQEERFKLFLGPSCGLAGLKTAFRDSAKSSPGAKYLGRARSAGEYLLGLKPENARMVKKFVLGRCP
jgi:hypothetical protein